MNIEFSVGFGKDGAREQDGSPNHILFVGDFSGSAPADPAGIRHMFSFDLLDIDAAIGRVAPALSLDENDEAALLTFAALEDFHPDELARGVSVFSTFRELKQSLSDPSKADAAARLCRQLLGEDPTATVDDRDRQTETGVPAGDASSDDMFTRLLGQPAGQSTPQSAQVKTAMDRILEQATRDENAPPQTSPDAARLEAGLDELMASAMRELLGSPQFQALESVWRSLQWFGERLETDDEVSAWLVDTGGSSPESWAPPLAARIVQEIGSAGTVILLDEFDDSNESLASLRAVTDLAANIGASVFAGASANLAGLTVDPAGIVAADRSHFSDRPAEDWDAVRAEPGAERVALAFPHILLRQPYGDRSDPVESFDFEELEPGPAHASFLWGNPAVAVALMSLADEVRIEDLPMVVYDDGGGQAIKPVSEIYLAESASDELLRRGIIPIIGNRGGTDIRVPRLQSMASQPTAI